MSKKKKEEPFKKIVFLLDADPYRQQCVVVINGEMSDAVKKMRKFKSPASEENIKDYEKDTPPDDFMKSSVQGRVYTHLPHGYVMLIKQDGWIETTSSIVHECLHLTHYVLRNAGMTQSKDSEEAYTYLCGKLVRDILARLYEPKK